MSVKITPLTPPLPKKPRAASDSQLKNACGGPGRSSNKPTDGEAGGSQPLALYKELSKAGVHEAIVMAVKEKTSKTRSLEKQLLNCIRAALTSMINS